jgi:hypothetical protein
MHKSFCEACGPALHRALLRLRHDENGFVTQLSLFLFLACLMIGGIALDGAHVTAQRTMLQGTSDSTAHAALLMRRKGTEVAAKSQAIAIAQGNMPTSRYGNVVTNEQIVFGNWDPIKRTFAAAPGSANAVRVVAQRRELSGNPVPNFLLRLVGMNFFDVTTVSVYATRNNPCFFNGIVASNGVDFSSNNLFRKDFCIHSNDWVKLQQNNTFETGAILSMPDFARLQLPSSGLSGNPGLADALREARVDLGIISELPSVIQGLVSHSSVVIPSYTTNTQPLEINVSSVKADSFVRGRVHRVNCSGNNGTLTLTNSMKLEQVVIVTNCVIRLGNGAQILDSIVATTSTDKRSISGVSGSGVAVSIGRACAPGPGAQFFTLGGMDFAAKLTVMGGQFVAVGDIAFASQAEVDGSGVSIVSGNVVNWSSNAKMGVTYCDAEFDNHRTEKKLRMVL